jgi:hypothetical protein
MEPRRAEWHQDRVRTKSDAAGITVSAAAIQWRRFRGQLEPSRVRRLNGFRAERRLGELMADMPKAEGGQPYQPTGFSKNPVERAPTLESQGIDKNLAHQARRAAALPEAEFEKLGGFNPPSYTAPWAARVQGRSRWNGISVNCPRSRAIADPAQRGASVKGKAMNGNGANGRGIIQDRGEFPPPPGAGPEAGAPAPDRPRDRDP